MTATQYLKESKVATSAELIALARTDKGAFEGLKDMAREQAKHEGIDLDPDGGVK